MKYKEHQTSEIDVDTPFHAVSILRQTYKNLDKLTNEAGKIRFGKMKNECSPYTFLPVNEYLWLCGQKDYKGPGGKHFNDYVMDNVPEFYPSALALAAMNAWYYTKHIYEIDNFLAQELIKTPFDGVVPLEALKKFPNFGIYIKCNLPELLPKDREDGRFLGFFCSLAARNIGKNGVDSLIFVTHLGHPPEYPRYLYQDSAWGEPISMPIYGENRTIQSHFEQSIEQNKHLVLQRFSDLSLGAWDLRGIEVCKKLINIVLYLCSTNLDVIDKSPNVEIHPFKPVTRKNVLGKFQILPALKPKIMSVGENISVALKKEAQLYKGSTSPVRPHVRRAHWHGYWTGPRMGERDFILKWIPPTLVGAHNGYVDNVMIG